MPLQINIPVHYGFQSCRLASEYNNFQAKTKHMKNALLLICSFFFASLLSAQSYRTAAGVRLGTGIGLSIQQKVMDKTTLEGILQSKLKSDELSLTLLLERHHNLLTRRLNFYVGGGVHKSWYTNTGEVTTKEQAAGISGIAGVEFTPGRLSVSWDYKPALNVWGGDQFFDSQTAVSLRYVFVKRKKKKINWKFWKKNNKKKKKR